MDQVLTTDQVWELLSDKLRSFLRSRVSDYDAADDLLQETFLRIHQKLGDLRDRERLISWVYRVARTLVIDYYRKEGRDPDVPMSMEPSSEPDSRNLNALVMGWFPEMVEELPENYREAVALYDLAGVPQQEIADRLNLSLSGAKSRVQRGRELLKAKLLDCCSFELDRQGNVVDYERRHPCDCD